MNYSQTDDNDNDCYDTNEKEKREKTDENTKLYFIIMFTRAHARFCLNAHLIWLRHAEMSSLTMYNFKVPEREKHAKRMRHFDNVAKIFLAIGAVGKMKNNVECVLVMICHVKLSWTKDAHKRNCLTVK